MQKYTEYQKEPDGSGGVKIPHLRGAAPGIYTADGGFIPWEKCTGGGKRRPLIMCGKSGSEITETSKLPLECSVVFPEGITSICRGAFSWRYIVSAVLPDSLVSLGEEAFAFSELSSVSFGRGLLRIPDRAFAAAYLRTAVLPPQISSVGELAFSHCCCLVSVSVLNRDGIGLGAGAFARCRDLSAVSFSSESSGVTGLPDAFSGCGTLRRIAFAGGSVPFVRGRHA